MVPEVFPTRCGRVLAFLFRGGAGRGGEGELGFRACMGFVRLSLLSAAVYELDVNPVGLESRVFGFRV